MKKHVWIMNHYAGGMYFSQGGRHYSFAKYLKQAGYEPVVFCANSRHGEPERLIETESLWEERTEESIGVPWVFVKARTYTGNGKQRVLNMLDFYRNVKRTAKEYAAKRGKPDVIYASSVHPLTLLAGIQLARRFHVECVCEVRDLWPESIVVYSSRFTRNHPLIKLLYQGEKWLYQKADRLIFTMEGAYDYIKERGWEKAVPRSKVFCINNGADLEAFRYNREHFRVEDPDLDDPDTVKIVYAGSIRETNKLGVLLDAAKNVANPRIKFLIWGDGDHLPALRKRAAEEHIENVVFKGRVEKKLVPSIISRADYNLVDGMGVDSSLFRYGLSPNKLFEYFAAGKPVVMCLRAKYNPVERFSCGLICGDTAEFSGLLERCGTCPAEDYALLCKGAEEAAREYDFQSLTRKLIGVLEGEA